MSILVLAFDIERSGATDQFTTIAIGCSVVNEQFEELDRLFLPGYIPRMIGFDPKCWSEFWTNNDKQLELCTYLPGELSRYGSNVVPYRQKEMITEFQNFRAKWEAKAKEMGAKLELVSDNNVFDGGFINQMIFTHLPKVLPIPYSASIPQEYGTFYETHSQQRGLLMALKDPTFEGNMGFSKRIFELYDVPPCTIPHHDHHHPCNDAYNIAYDQQVLHGIRKGIYKLKN